MTTPTQTVSSHTNPDGVGFEETACPKCGSWSGRVVVVGKDHLHGLPGRYPVSECAGCGLWFLNPRPASHRLASLYPDDYAPHADASPAAYPDDLASHLATSLGYRHLAASDAVRPSLRAPLDRARIRWKAAVRLIPRFVAGGSVLEIGAASGARLAALRSLGWTDLHGIELVPAAAERAKAQGFAIACGSVEETLDTYAARSFDVVISSMVLEHLANPFAVVKQVATKLRSGGEFLFSTVTRDSLDARVFGEYWGGFDFPRHLVFLRDVDIVDMVGPQFEIIDRVHHAAPQDFIRSATWRRHEGRWIDRLMLAVADPVLQYRVGLALAWAGLTCRVSYRCRRREDR